MGLRRDARKLAVRVLYLVDILGVTPDSAIEIIGANNYSADTLNFADNLIKGTVKNLEKIDSVILENTKNWEMERIACVDKAILRMGLYEIFFEKSIPRNATINEAVELAKYFSTSKSHKFINGILDTGTKDEKTSGSNKDDA